MTIWKDIRHNSVFFYCPCTFKTFSALHTHFPRRYGPFGVLTSGKVLSFTCQNCVAGQFSTEEFFVHLKSHLKIQETVECVFKHCDFKTNFF